MSEEPMAVKKKKVKKRPQVKRSRGRPPKVERKTHQEIVAMERTYHVCKYQEAFNGMLKEHMAKGLSFHSFNVPGGVSYSTLNNWCKRFPLFAHAREEGERTRLKFLESEGLKMVKAGNVMAWKFLMMQHGMSEKVEIEHAHTIQTPGQANVRLQRLEKLRELNARIDLRKEPEPTIITAEYVEVEDELFGL